MRGRPEGPGGSRLHAYSALQLRHTYNTAMEPSARRQAVMEKWSVGMLCGEIPECERRRSSLLIYAKQGCAPIHGTSKIAAQNILSLCSVCHSGGSLILEHRRTQMYYCGTSRNHRSRTDYKYVRRGQLDRGPLVASSRYGLRRVDGTTQSAISKPWNEVSVPQAAGTRAGCNGRKCHKCHDDLEETTPRICGGRQPDFYDPGNVLFAVTWGDFEADRSQTGT